MAIPDYQSLMLPLLEYASDQKEHSVKDATSYLSERFKLTDEERDTPLPSGSQLLINNRVGWARTYLKKAGLLDSPKRSYLKITERGQELLSSKPQLINVKLLEQYAEFVEFRTRKNTKEDIAESPHTDNFNTPQEALEYGLSNLNATLADDLLETIKGCSPYFFEKLVVELVVKMGYGGSRKEAGKVIGRSGDEGIDGIIKEDKLGLDTIYIQAKKWENAVGRPEIQKFVGALAGQRAKKGIFITTSWFTTDAHNYVNSIDHKIVLIDGTMLTQLMIDFNLGVTIVETIEIKRLDSDYFTDE